MNTKINIENKFLQMKAKQNNVILIAVLAGLASLAVVGVIGYHIGKQSELRKNPNSMASGFNSGLYKNDMGNDDHESEEEENRRFQEMKEGMEKVINNRNGKRIR